MVFPNAVLIPFLENVSQIQLPTQIHPGQGWGRRVQSFIFISCRSGLPRSKPRGRLLPGLQAASFHYPLGTDPIYKGPTFISSSSPKGPTSTPAQGLELGPVTSGGTHATSLERPGCWVTGAAGSYAKNTQATRAIPFMSALGI